MALKDALGGAARWTWDSVRGKSDAGPVSKGRQVGTIAALVVVLVAIWPNGQPTAQTAIAPAAGLSTPPMASAARPTPSAIPSPEHEQTATPEAPPATQDASRVETSSPAMASAPSKAPAATKAPEPTQPAAKEPKGGSAPSGDCNIKGNISNKGEKIYHVPGQQYYGRTKIDPSKGERMFCSEAEAREAGWRKAKV